MAAPAILAGLGHAVVGAASKSMRDTAKGGITNLTATSLVEFTQAARVEPICVVDRTLINLDALTDVAKVMLSRYTAFYLAAGSMVGDIGSIKTIQALDKINPSRTPSYTLANSILSSLPAYESAVVNPEDIGSELQLGDNEHLEDDTQIHQENENISELVKAQHTAYELQLPTYDDEKGEAVSHESIVNANRTGNNWRNQTANANGNYSLNETTGDHNQYSQDGRAFNNQATYVTGSHLSDMQVVSNLSVGHLVNLKISDGHASREIPVNIRLISYPTDQPILLTILKWSEKDNSLKSRWRAYKAGELNGWRDLIFMRDVYAERKQALMNDKTGLFRSMISRVNKNTMAGVVSMSPSVGTISSIAIVSESTIEMLQDEIDGKFETFSVRQRIMNATGLMLVAVVDPASEMVKIYTYSQALPEEYSLKQIKGASKGGDDIADLIKILNPAGAVGRL